MFIQAKNGPYGFDICPAFWNWLIRQARAGTVYSSIMVYEELVNGDDELAEWVGRRENRSLFVGPNASVQAIYRSIIEKIRANRNYAPHHVKSFLDKADPWVIAQAKNDGSVVVTQETLAGMDTKKVKIPNICAELGVDYKDTYQMLRALKASF